LLETKFTLATFIVCCHSNNHLTARAYPSRENKQYLSGMTLFKIVRQKFAIITTKVNTGLFCNSIFNVKKRRGQDFTRQCSYKNCFRWANYKSSGCKFPIVYMCQKLRKLV